MKRCSMGTQEESLTRVKGVKASGTARTQLAMTSLGLIRAYDNSYVDAKDVAEEVHRGQSRMGLTSETERLGFLS